MNIHEDFEEFLKLLNETSVEYVNAISGLTFDQVWDNRQAGDYGDAKVFFISKGDLLTNKMASGRPQDLADVAELQRVD